MDSLRHPRPRQVPVALRVYTLGTFRLEESGCPIALPARAHNRPLALLKVLVALGAEDVPVDPLCAHLWPDADGDHAIDAFNTTLLRLRRCIGYGAVRLAGGRLSLDPACVWLDVREVRRWLAQGREAVRARDPERAAAAARAALEVYQGPFLDGEHEPAPIGLARERLQDELARTIENTAALLHEAGRREDAIALSRAGIDAHPTAEALCRRLMRGCLEAGRHTEGLETYERCRAALAAHLSTEPASETIALHVSLRAAAQPVAGNPPEPTAIAVGPFRPLGAERQLQPLVEGLAEDLMTGLARTTLLGVVSHTIAARADARPDVLQALARDFGIAYVLNGSVQQSDRAVRAHVRLLDTRSGREVWGERFRGDADNLFGLQDQITQCVVEEVDRLLFSGEHFLLARYSSANAEAARLFLEAQKDALRRPGRDGSERALRTARRALALDPGMACAEVVVASLHMGAVEQGWSLDPRRELEQARDSIERAMAHRPDLGMVHACQARLRAFEGVHDEALTAAERGVACEAGRPDLSYCLAHTQLLAGEPARAVASAERATRMTVRRPPTYLSWLGAAYLMAGRPEAALRWLANAARLMPASPTVRLWLAAAHAALGQREAGRTVASDVREHAPGFDPDYWARRGLPFRLESDRQRLSEWLRVAGVPITMRSRVGPKAADAFISSSSS